MCNSPIDNLTERLNQAEKDINLLKKQLSQYKKIGTVEFCEPKQSSQIHICVSEGQVFCEFSNHRFTVTSAEFLMLANLNGMFDTHSGDSQ